MRLASLGICVALIASSAVSLPNPHLPINMRSGNRAPSSGTPLATIASSLKNRGGGAVQSAGEDTGEKKSTKDLLGTVGPVLWSLSLFKGCAGLVFTTLAQPVACGNGLFPSLLVVWTTVALSAWAFSQVMVLQAKLGASSLKECWEMSNMRWAWVIDAVLVFYSICCCSCYSPFLADTIVPLLRSTTWAPAWCLNRAILKTVLSFFVLIPMSLLRGMGDLKAPTVIGAMSIPLFIGLMILRWADGSYAPGGVFGPVLGIKLASVPLWSMGSLSGLVTLAIRTTFGELTHRTAQT